MKKRLSTPMSLWLSDSGGGGLVATITYFLIWFEEREFVKGNWKFALPVLLSFSPR